MKLAAREFSEETRRPNASMLVGGRVSGLTLEVPRQVDPFSPRDHATAPHFSSLGLASVSTHSDFIQGDP